MLISDIEKVSMTRFRSCINDALQLLDARQ
jgi:hypothetical protein